MKKIFSIIAISMAFAMTANADDRPVVFEQLPLAAQSFIKQYYPEDKISYATKDDDLILPEYTVVLVSGVKVVFENSGALEKVEAKKDGVPAGLVPVQIREYVKNHYPDALIQEYEVGRRSYEVKLSNMLELKFNKNFMLIGIDD